MTCFFTHVVKELATYPICPYTPELIAVFPLVQWEVLFWRLIVPRAVVLLGQMTLVGWLSLCPWLVDFNRLLITPLGEVEDPVHHHQTSINATLSHFHPFKAVSVLIHLTSKCLASPTWLE